VDYYADFQTQIFTFFEFSVSRSNFRPTKLGMWVYPITPSIDATTNGRNRSINFFEKQEYHGGYNKRESHVDYYADFQTQIFTFFEFSVSRSNFRPTKLGMWVYPITPSIDATTNGRNRSINFFEKVI
ncbi:hypothetical protein PRIPAC_72232, partial [Pristionchus pacificus]|uniref:Uncharacterized protein n=1 Tax=Pristionchus pacificus TaxID=54126 RepID=A0A2A6D024_PRIPA